MAGVTVFHYFPGKSFLHKADPRFKIGAMFFLSLTVMSCRSFFYLALLLLIIGGGLFSAGLPLSRLLSELRPVIFYCGTFFLIYSLAMPGYSRVSMLIPGLTWEGITEGLLYGWRFTLLLLMGLLFTGTTTSQNICEAVETLLRPLPWIPETRIATMMGLTFILTPLILDQIAEMLEAQTSRSVFLRRSPIYRIRCLAIPLCARIVHRAEQLAEAMEARCYSEERTRPVFRAAGSDWTLLVFTGLIYLSGLLVAW